MDKDEVNNLLDRAFPLLDTLLPEFDFKFKKKEWVSGNTLKVDGSFGDSPNRVYVYDNATFCLKDYRGISTEISTEIPTYLVQSNFHSKITNRSEALAYIENHVNEGPTYVPRKRECQPFVKSTGELIDIQSGNVRRLEKIKEAYFKSNENFRGLSDKQFSFFEIGTPSELNEISPETLLNIPLAIPIYTRGRDLSSWITYRHNGGIRYTFPRGDKPLIEFKIPSRGLEKVTSFFDEDEIILTEGVFDCLTAWGCGLTNTIGLGGCVVSSHQIVSLGLNGIKKIILILDTDTSGVNGAVKSSQLLKEKGFSVFTLTLPPLSGHDKVDLDLYLRELGLDSLLSLLKDRDFVNCNVDPAPLDIPKLSPELKFNSFIDGLNYKEKVIETRLPFSNIIRGYLVGTISTVVGKTGHGKTTFLLNQCVDALCNGYKVSFLTFEERGRVIYNKLFIVFLGGIIEGRFNGQSDIAGFKKLIEILIEDPDRRQGTPDVGFLDKENLVGYFLYILRNRNHKHYLTLRSLYHAFYEKYVKPQFIGVYYDQKRKSETLFDEVENHYKNKGGLDLVIVDYIQQIEYPEISTRTIELKHICIDLRNASINNNFAVLMGAQYNRSVSNIDDSSMSKIADCCEIERSSHFVFSLWNAQMEYLSDHVPYPLGMSNEVSVQLRVLKSREGNLAKGYYSHNKRYNTLSVVNPEYVQGDSINIDNFTDAEEEAPF